LWRLPDAVANWLGDESSVLVAEDVSAMLGRFSSLCGAAPRNLGMRGLPPGFDLEGALRTVLGQLGEDAGPLVSELDEQGLQLAAVTLNRDAHVVSVAQVSICSPFPPHAPWLGECGAHFCGLNARSLGWTLHDRPAEEYVREHWRKHRAELYDRVGLHNGSGARGLVESA
jgi:hypothetical protein